MPEGQEAEVADFSETVRQDVLHKSADKFPGIQHHLFPDTGTLVILIPEAYRAIFMGDDPLVGDGHAVGVIAQVADQVVGPLEGLFTIYHPVGFVAGLFDRLKGCVVLWQGKRVVSEVFFQQ